MKELDLTKAVAERSLREHKGDLIKALHALTEWPCIVIVYINLLWCSTCVCAHAQKIAPPRCPRGYKTTSAILFPLFLGFYSVKVACEDAGELSFRAPAAHLWTFELVSARQMSGYRFICVCFRCSWRKTYFTQAPKRRSGNTSWRGLFRVPTVSLWTSSAQVGPRRVENCR